jgi:PAS domain S-box-containing protein
MRGAMYEHMELTIELFRIYLRDDSETAHIAAIDALARSFDAFTGAIFFVDAGHCFRFCMAGTKFPIMLEESRWNACAEKHVAGEEIGTFRDWIPPGFDNPVAFWISAELELSDFGAGFVFLGKNENPWNEVEMVAFAHVIKAVGELVDIRRTRDLEKISRLEAERVLSENERRMFAFFTSAHDMIYTTDAENRFTNINQAGIMLLGVESPSEVIGHPFSEFLSNAQDLDFFMDRIMRNGYIADHEIVLKKKNGTVLFCLETSHAVRDETGTLVEIQGFVKDISDRIKNERELWKMNLELSEVNLKLQQAQTLMVQHEKLASIGQLAAGVAHEINNPLGFLKSNHGMLRRYFDSFSSAWKKFIALSDPEIAKISVEYDLEYLFEQASLIFRESDEGFARIMGIVSNLMSFSRMGQSQDMELYDVNAGIDSTLVVAWNEIKYVADVSKKYAELPKIFARGGEINQVLLNILVNAAQAIASQKRSSRGKISIETGLTDDSVFINIADDGPGIPTEIISRVFDPFFTTKEPGKGTGLGLSISYDIVVNKHKGKISAHSDPGKGSVFRIELPANLASG